MAHDEVDGLRKVFARHLCAPCPVLDGKGIVAHFAQCDGKRKPLMDSPDVGESTTGTDNGERSARLATEKEQPCIVLASISLLVRFGIDVIKEAVAFIHIVNHRVDGFHGSLACHIIVVRKQVCYIRKRHIIVIPPFGRQDELSESDKRFMLHHILYCI